MISLQLNRFLYFWYKILINILSARWSNEDGLYDRSRMRLQHYDICCVWRIRYLRSLHPELPPHIRLNPQIQVSYSDSWIFCFKFVQKECLISISITKVDPSIFIIQCAQNWYLKCKINSAVKRYNHCRISLSNNHQ